MRRNNNLSLMWRGPGWNITRELTDIKSRLEVAGSSKPRVTLATLATPRVLKPLLIGMAPRTTQKYSNYFCIHY